MQKPRVTETSALSAHRREVALVRWSLLAVPAVQNPKVGPDGRDPLRAIDHGLPRTVPLPNDW